MTVVFSTGGLRTNPQYWLWPFAMDMIYGPSGYHFFVAQNPI